MSADGFNYDNMFIRLLNRLGDLMLLSILFVVSCIPIVTIGAALTATSYTAMNAVKGDDGYIWKNYKKSFMQNFKQSTVMWLIMIAALAILGVDTWFWIKQNIAGVDIAKPFVVISVILLSLAIMILIYVFPLQARFDNKMFVQFRNSFLLSIKNFPRTLLIIVILLVVGVLFYDQVVLSVIGFVLIGFGILAFIIGYIMNAAFKPYIVTEDTEGKGEASFNLDEINDGEEEQDEPEEQESEEQDEPAEPTQQED